MRPIVHESPLRGHHRHLAIVTESERLARAGLIRRDRLASLNAYDELRCLPPLGAREVAMLDLYAGATLDSNEIEVTR